MAKSSASEPLNQDFRDILVALKEAKAKFVVIGAFAVSFHTQPRATGDLDVLVEPSPENAKRVFSSLVKFGAPLHDLTEKDLSKPGIIFQMGLVPRRIDILTRVTGLTFEEVWKNRSITNYGDLTVAVMGRQTLLRNKKAVGRKKDLADVEALQKKR